MIVLGDSWCIVTALGICTSWLWVPSNGSRTK